MIRLVVSILIGLMSLVALLLINFFPIWWIVLLILVVWLGLIVFLGIRLNKKGERQIVNLVLSIIVGLAFVVLLMLLEWEGLRYLLIVLAGIVMAFLFSQVCRFRGLLSHETKPFRRMIMMSWVFVSYVLATFLFALDIFFETIPFWPLALLTSVLIGIVTLIIWQMYFSFSLHKFVLWAIILSLAVWEIIWAIHLLPLGYLVLGALVTWMWYIIQLLIRFHLSKQGIMWKKQIVFLSTNIILYFIILFFFVRWI